MSKLGRSRLCRRSSEWITPQPLVAIERRRQEPSNERRHTNIIRLEPVDQYHHPLVLLIEHIARLFAGHELTFADGDGALAPELLSPAVDGCVVAGEERGNGDVLRFELGHFRDLLGDDLEGVVAGVISVFGTGGVVGSCCLACLDCVESSWKS